MKFAPITRQSRAQQKYSVTAPTTITFTVDGEELNLELSPKNIQTQTRKGKKMVILYETSQYGEPIAELDNFLVRVKFSLVLVENND